MPPDALPQLLDTLLRLPLLEPAQIKELLENLPDPQASAQEMLRRGWITQTQFSSLHGHQEQRKGRETLLVGCGEEDVPPDADCDNWNLPLTEEEDTAALLPETELPQLGPTAEETLDEPDPIEVLPSMAGAAAAQFEWDNLATAAAGNEVRTRESATDRCLGQWMRWASKGLLMWAFFLGSFLTGLQFFGADSKAQPVARKEATPVARNEAKKTRVADRRTNARDAAPLVAPAKAKDEVAARAKEEVAAGDPNLVAAPPVIQADPPLPRVYEGDGMPKPGVGLISSNQAQPQLTPPVIPSSPGLNRMAPPIQMLPARNQNTRAGAAQPSHTRTAGRAASSQGPSRRSQ